MCAAIVIIDAKGNLRSSNLKDGSVDTVYKRCGFRRPTGFILRHRWKALKPDSHIAVYARDHGKAGNENKYDLPPPVDETLFYGSIALIQTSADGCVEGLSIAEWEKNYEHLFGGFDDIAATAEEDEDEVDELADVPDAEKTKHGYLKDGWIVDDGAHELEEEDYN